MKSHEAVEVVVNKPKSKFQKAVDRIIKANHASTLISEDDEETKSVPEL